MTKTEAQELLDKIYDNKCSPEEKQLAYSRLSELINILLPEE